jgi:hypothetical protein
MSIGFVIYTNETNLPILKLFLKYFFKHNPSFNFPIYAVSNKFTRTDLPYNDKVDYLSGEVEWHSAGGHFSQTLINVLPQIKEDYIFYFCEDYILTDSIDLEKLEQLLLMMQSENIDMFSFASMYPVNHGWSQIEQQYFEIPLYKVNLHYEHAYSVQPCIWKKSSLQNILQDNPFASLHDMDNSILKNKDQYKITCTDLKIYDQAFQPDYFIVGYKEIIRHGVFLMTLNGQTMLEDNHAEVFIRKLIKDENLHNNPEYDKYILFDKKLITW